MALTKNCTLLSQVIIGYFEVDKVTFFPKQSLCCVEASGYISKAAKDAGATPAWTGNFKWDTTGGALAPQVLSLVEQKLGAAIDEGAIK